MYGIITSFLSQTKSHLVLEHIIYMTHTGVNSLLDSGVDLLNYYPPSPTNKGV